MESVLTTLTYPIRWIWNFLFPKKFYSIEESIELPIILTSPDGTHRFIATYSGFLEKKVGSFPILVVFMQNGIDYFMEGDYSKADLVNDMNALRRGGYTELDKSTPDEIWKCFPIRHEILTSRHSQKQIEKSESHEGHESREDPGFDEKQVHGRVVNKQSHGSRFVDESDGGACRIVDEDHDQIDEGHEKQVQDQIRRDRFFDEDDGGCLIFDEGREVQIHDSEVVCPQLLSHEDYDKEVDESGNSTDDDSQVDVSQDMYDNVLGHIFFNLRDVEGLHNCLFSNNGRNRGRSDRYEDLYHFVI